MPRVSDSRSADISISSLSLEVRVALGRNMTMVQILLRFLCFYIVVAKIDSTSEINYELISDPIYVPVCLHTDTA